MNKRFILTLFSICYILLMVFGAAYPHPDSIPGFGGNTKIFHFLGFALLAVFVLKTLQLYEFKHPFVIGIIFMLVFIYFTEFIQLFTGRDFAYFDMLIDAAGMIVGLGVYKWIFYKR